MLLSMPLSMPRAMLCPLLMIFAMLAIFC